MFTYEENLTREEIQSRLANYQLELLQLQRSGRAYNNERFERVSHLVSEQLDLIEHCSTEESRKIYEQDRGLVDLYMLTVTCP